PASRSPRRSREGPRGAPCPRRPGSSRRPPTRTARRRARGGDRRGGRRGSRRSRGGSWFPRRFPSWPPPRGAAPGSSGTPCGEHGAPPAGDELREGREREWKVPRLAVGEVAGLPRRMEALLEPAQALVVVPGLAVDEELVREALRQPRPPPRPHFR